ncbi:carbohydrate-binding protein [Fulvivirga ligni]|uniref:carbohydrate-binding protein n=1 Tax=Fulvivirga ligni TaxID=2904246 RepID=UPI001F3CB689|nr:carbohydrate-binding protein [Fulvivirga ligni]UII20649.1 carbohydrate-binding protein [Fulvivirga ligni]
MHKQLLTYLACFTFSVLSYSGFAQGFLKASGTRIIDSETEENVLWRGIGLGGWMLQEGYMLQTSGAQHEIEARIEELVGETKKQQFYDAWLSNHTREIDIDSMSSWGFNMVRLPMHYKLFTLPIEEEPVQGQNTWLDKGFELTDNLLAWCKANNIYLILDLHAAPGGQGENADISDYDPSKPSLWESQDNKNKMIALWKKLAERYADEPMIGGYDIINEPNWGFQNHESDPNGCAESSNAQLWQLEKDITAAIREVDQNHIIIIEGNCWGNNYSGLPSLWDNNMVISFHKYWNSNEVGAIQGMLNMRNSRNVPIWLGETGENSNKWFTNAVALFESNNMGWSWWPLKKLGGNNPLQIKKPDAYQSVLNYWNGGAKPSESVAFDGLMQFAENTKLENTIFKKDVVDALIRQPHTDETKPFKQHIIEANGEENVVFAVNYDLGKDGFAYYDKVSTNTTGNAGGASWNNGGQYRNDGVDIEACLDETTNGYNVGWTEDGEWLQYTIDVEEEGMYSISVRTASSGDGKISFYSDNVRVAESTTMLSTGGYQLWKTTTINDVYLKAGRQKLKVQIDVGGFNFNYFQINGPSEVTEKPKVIEKKAIDQKKKVGLIFNQPFISIPEDHGFTASINGNSVEIDSVVLNDDASQMINIYLSQEVSYGDEVLISYSGTEIKTIYDMSLDAFSDLLIDIFLEGGALPLSVPGRIEAEDFTVNNGFELETTQDTGGGQNVGYTDNGDYLDYDVEVEETGYFKVGYRVASEEAGGSLSLHTVDAEGNAEEISSVAFSATGGWQDWSTASGSMAFLEKGYQTIRLQATASLFNINWFELTYLGPDLPTGIDEKSNGTLIYPNPTDGPIQIHFTNAADVKLVVLSDASGKKIWSGESKGSSEFSVNQNLRDGLYFITITEKDSAYTKRVLVRK